MHARTPSNRLASLALVAAAAIAIALAACDGSHADHDHAPHADGHAPHADGDSTKTNADAGHDHEQAGHDHADADHDHADAGHDHADEVTLSAQAIAQAGITIQTARVRSLEPTFVAPARVAFNADAMAHVGSPLHGRAVALKVRLGDRVAQGDALLVIESPELGEAQAEYFQKRIHAQSAAAPVELAKVAWERAKSLYEEAQGISLTQVQEREAQYRAAVAAQQSAQAAAVGAENRLHILGMAQASIEELANSGQIAPRFTIHAPIAGTVIEREVTLGELVGPDRETLLVLADTTNPWILADVPEARLGQTRVGAAAWVTVGAVASDSSRGLEGTVDHIAPLVDAATRTAQVRIALANAPAWLTPGMFAQVEIAAADPREGAPAEVVAIPDSAVQTVEGRTAVFVPVASEEGAFAVRPVRVGPVVHGVRAVLDGLAEGEAFVASGSFILKAELGKGSAAHEH